MILKTKFFGDIEVPSDVLFGLYDYVAAYLRADENQRLSMNNCMGSFLDGYYNNLVRSGAQTNVALAIKDLIHRLPGKYHNYNQETLTQELVNLLGEDNFELCYAIAYISLNLEGKIEMPSWGTIGT